MALMLAVASASAQTTITELWRYNTNVLNANWSDAAPKWTNPKAIKSMPCSRFATASNGKIFTINMKTMSIAQITVTGWQDVYKLPYSGIDGDFYGTAISSDQAGHFLVGHYFTQAPESSIVWSVYDPSTSSIERFEIPVGDDYSVTSGGQTYAGVGRIDCVGRVLGDLTKEAVFFVGSSFGSYAPYVRMVKISHDADGKLIVDTDHSPEIVHNVDASTLTIAQPKDSSYDEFVLREHAESGFIMYANAGGGVNDFVTFSDTGAYDSSLADNSDIKSVANASTSGFDSFVLDGQRYFVINHLETYDKMNCNTMNIAVVREDGVVVGTWENPDYASQYGYSSIIAEPLADGTANIYIYNSTVADTAAGRRACAAAAVIKFDPSKYVPVDYDTPGLSAENPLIVESAQDLVDLKGKLVSGDNYIALDCDIDMNGIGWSVLCAEGSTSRLHIDGRYHVIRNLRPLTTAQNGSLVGYLSGSVKNLGLEDVSIINSWYCVGGIAGVANDAKIDNCYVTGSITGAASGALVGCNKGPLTITNCYSFADAADRTGAAEYSGGLVGCSDAALSISNSYASCTVTSTGGHAGGIVAVQHSTSVNLRDVVAWTIAVDGKTMAAPVCAGGCVSNNVKYWNGMEINGVKTDGGVSDEELREEILKWSAFNEGKVNVVTDYPALNWQEIFVTSDIEDILADKDDADGQPVYYNLQGVRTDNPGRGIYIVRRGNKVTKEFVR